MKFAMRYEDFRRLLPATTAVSVPSHFLEFGILYHPEHSTMRPPSFQTKTPVHSCLS
jgi:hypothetical protein